MKKTILRNILVLPLIFVVLAAATASVLAVKPTTSETTKIESIIGWGQCVVDATASGHLKFTIIGQHFGWSDFYGGKADRINIASGGLIAYEDNPTRYEFSTQTAGSGTANRYLVGENIIQVRIVQRNNVHKDKTVLISWLVPLILKQATETTPEVAIPPGSIELQGYGPASEIGSSQTYSHGWTGTNQYTKYSAVGTFICPEWNYEGPVYGPPDGTPTIGTDGTYTWTKASSP